MRSSTTAETVARVRPVAAATSAREGGRGAAAIRPSTTARFSSRRLPWRTAEVGAAGRFTP
ncbi:hypothetical protein [Micromonospora olivasterospora]|uniref:hypothetical protein n=1 Tax=Micromonospora olivasterospora TaxID=1880 RepID=UPI001FE7DD2C|nr:hypothetical protein [Micromonospora olivasterospora]